MTTRWVRGAVGGLIAVMLGLSPAHGFGRGSLVGSARSQLAILAGADQGTPASLPQATPGQQPSGEPFGLATTPVITGKLVSKWQAVKRRIDAEAAILGRCRAQQECPTAAREFLDVVAEGRRHSGLARVGVINRAINLAIARTDDMRQWGEPDHWSAPLETLTAGRGDCEDYAIAKYVALLNAGFSEDDVKLVVVHEPRFDEDHAVVASRLNGRWLLLDNRWLALVPDAEIRNQIPRFILDDTGVKAFLLGTSPARLAESDGAAERRDGVRGSGRDG